MQTPVRNLVYFVKCEMENWSLLFADDKIECRGIISTREEGRGGLPTWAGLGCTGTRATKARVSMEQLQEPVVVTTGRAQIEVPNIL